MIRINSGPREWENLHTTVKHQIADLIDVANEQSLSKLEAYNDTTAGIRGILADCVQKKLSVKAMGGNWSLSPLIANDGVIINTRLLNMSFSISEESTDANYSGQASDLYFVQCGTAIWELNERLNPKGKSLKTCGASNGQTIVGAMSTGTHGAAIDFGAIQDYVVGIHLITGPESDIFLERQSYPVINENFTNKLQTDLVRNDAHFDAVLVSMGAMGFIHGVIIETEPLFLLEATMRKVPLDDAMYKLMTKLEFKHPQLPYPGERPFQFQVMINPYDLKKGVNMTCMYKRPYTSDYEPPVKDQDGIGPGDDAPSFIGLLTDAVPALVPKMVNGLLAGRIKPYEKQLGTLAEIFSNFTIRGKVASSAIGINAKDTEKVIKLLLQYNEDAGPFMGLIACRYVGKSKASMAFTKYATTCVIELDGILNKKAIAFYRGFCQKLEDEKIDFTYHWGKINELNTDRVKRMYGSNLTNFVLARLQLLSPHMLTAFNNGTTKAWGMETTDGSIFFDA